MKDFKVNILNKEEIGLLFERWGTFAVKCYNTPIRYAKNVGKSCLTTGHFSGSRSRYIEIEIENVPRALIDQLIRKEQGFVKNVASGRYIDYSNFEYYTPPVIANCEEAKEIYDRQMESTRKAYAEISEALNKKGITGEKNFEACRGVAPMNYRSGLVVGMTIESLISLCNARLCVRSQEHIRHLVKLIRDEVVAILPELDEYLVPACVGKLYCPEGKRSCGRFPQKDELKQALELVRANKKTV